MTLTQLFTNIANAIRAKTGSSETIKAEDFPTEIADITTGITPTGTITITQNGTVDVSNYASADVNVPIPTPNLQSKSVTITENGTQTITPDTGYDGLNEVEVTTNVQATSEYNAKLSTQGMTNLSLNYSMRKIGDLDLTGMTSCANSFNYCANLIEIGELSNSSSVTNMSSMFSGCSSLISLGTSTFGSTFSTANVTNGMSSMFQYCSNLQSLDLTNFNTRKVTYMTRMFSGCSNLETITFGTDFSLEKCTNASSLQQMFGACSKLTNTTLNAILGILATYAGTSNKTLQYIGLTQTQAETCQGLSNYQAFLNAGWTTGY